MIHRRRFLQMIGGTGGALLAGEMASVQRAAVLAAGPGFDKAAAARELADHRIANITARQVHDRFPRSIGPNSRGQPVGGGGSYRVRTIATDKGVEGWAMCHLSDEAVQPFVGRRVGDLFDVATGAADEAGALDKALHDLAGNILEEFTDRLYRLAEAKLVDVFVLDLGIVGFTRWRKLMPELESAGIKASPHLWMWTPRTYYCAQLAAGVNNVCIIEGIPGRAPEIDYSAYQMTDGKLVVPETPGFGLKLV